MKPFNLPFTFFKFLIIFCVSVSFNKVKFYALDFIQVFDGLSSSFSTFVDPNEGLTSFPSLNITSGGREESLGGSFTGLCDDICFFDYNPAASCVLENTEFAVFHNSWISDSNIETIAGTMRFGDLGVGAKIKCFYVPFTEYNTFGDRVASNYYSETTGTLNVSYNFLHGYYFKGLAVGGSFKFGWRSIPDYADDNTGAIIKNSGLTQSSLALMIDLGLLLQFNAAKLYNSREPNLKIGLSVLNAGASITGFKSAQGVQLDDPLPTAVAAGISYRIFKPLAITIDFKQPLNLKDFSKSAMWQAGVGVDVNINNFVEVMAGFRLKGANPRFSLGGEFTIKKFIVDVNYTFDLTSSINPVNHFSLSCRVNFGDKGRKEKRERADKLYCKGLEEYSKENYDLAISYWEAALELDKSLDPARRWIKTVQKSQKLYKRVIDMQILD